MLLFFALFLYRSQAQKAELYNIHFEIDDETSATAIHQIVQDSIGLVWLATDKGIVRFDGVGYKQYDLSHIAPSNEFFGVTKDTNGTFWFFSAERLLVSYDLRTDSFFESPLNDALRKIGIGVIKNIFWQDDSVFIQCSDPYLYVLYQKNNRLQSVDLNQGYDKKLLLIVHDRIVLVDLNKDSKTIIYTYCGKELFRTEFSGLMGANRRAVFIDSVGSLLAGNQRLFSMNSRNEKVASTKINYTQTPNGLFRDSQGNIWVGFYNHGAICINKDFSSTDTVLFESTITTFFEGRNGEIWASSLNDGFFLLRQPKNRVSFYSHDNIKYVFEFEEVNFNVTKNGVVSYFNSASDKYEILNGSSLVSSKPRLMGDTVVVSNSKGTNFIWVKKNSVFVKHVEHRAPYKWILRSKNNSETRIEYDWPYTDTIRLILSSEVKRVFWPVDYRNSKVLAINNLGDIFSGAYVNKHAYFNSETNEVMTFDSTYLVQKLERVQQVEFIDEDRVLITDFTGLFSWNRHKPELLDTVFFNQNFQIRNAKYLNDTLWLATDKGLFYTIDKHNAKLAYAITLNQKTTQVNDFYFNQALLILATGEGVYYSKRSNIYHKKPLVIYEARTKTNIMLSNNILLGSDEGYLNFSWSQFDFTDRLKKQYRWRLSENEPWTSTNSNRLSLSSIGFGKYQFEVQQLNVDGKWSESAMQYFEVDRPYYLKLPFILLVSLIVSGMVTFGVYLRLRVVNERFRLKEGLFEAQSQALSAQLNPHFIFNSMNTVSSFIAQEDDTKALRYISKLSVLLRRIFANSQLASISLSEELQSVKEYVEIEQLRFGKKLKFHFENKTEADLDVIQTPAMLIQPFVENAIKHAVLKRETGGNIWLTVTETQTNVCVTIEDDGPGLTEQDLFERAKQGSSSISAIQKRLDIMKLMKQESATLTVEQGEKGAKIKLSLIKPNLS